MTIFKRVGPVSVPLAFLLVPTLMLLSLPLTAGEPDPAAAGPPGLSEALPPGVSDALAPGADDNAIKDLVDHPGFRPEIMTLEETFDLGPASYDLQWC